MERMHTSVLTVTVSSVRTEDVIALGGISRTVVDMCDIAGGRKKLAFEDHNFLILPRTQAISVTRHTPRSTAPAGRLARPVRATQAAARFLIYPASAR